MRRELRSSRAARDGVREVAPNGRPPAGDRARMVAPLFATNDTVAPVASACCRGDDLHAGGGRYFHVTVAFHPCQ